MDWNPNESASVTGPSAGCSPVSASCTTIAALVPANTRLREPVNIPAALLAKHLPFAADPTCSEGGVVAIGRLAIGQLRVGRANMRSGQIDELRITRLIIEDLRIDRTR